MGKNDPSGDTYDRVVAQIDNAFENSSMKHFIILKKNGQVVQQESPVIQAATEDEILAMDIAYQGARAVFFEMQSTGSVSFVSGSIVTKNRLTSKDVFVVNSIALSDFEKELTLIDLKIQLALMCAR